MGPLSGFKIIELAGIGPGPFCGMMLSDMGAEVIRVERLSGADQAPKDVLARNRRSVALDLKSPGQQKVSICQMDRPIWERHLFLMASTHRNSICFQFSWISIYILPMEVISDITSVLSESVLEFIRTR